MFKHTTLILALVLSLTSCAAIKENLGIDPPEVNSAGMGAATGAAIGAATGAIIGSTSGDAGQGLLLGGAVGAASGAVIGSELGERDQEYASHKQTLDSQERQIQNQSRQLDQLRGSTFDTSGRFVIPAQNRSSRGGYAARNYNRPSNDVVTNQLRARLSEPSVKSNSLIAPETKTVLAKGGTAINSAPANAYASSNSLAKSAPVKEFEAPKIEPVAKQVEAKKEVAIKHEEPKLEAFKQQTITKTEAKKSPEVNTLEDKSVKTEAPKNNTEVAKKTTEDAGSCSEAEGEAKRARSAATDTDKIFYYRRALRLCKSKPEYHVEMGKVYTSIGRKEEAEFEFSKALEIDPNNRDAQDELTVLMLDSAN